MSNEQGKALQVGTNPPRNIEILKANLNAPSVQEQFKNALKDNRDGFVASLIDVYSGDKQLQECDPNAVIMEALKAAVLKLPINKQLGFAYLLVYNNSVKTPTGWIKVPTPTFMIGYKGYIQLAMRTGQYKTLNADIVYEGEVRKVNKLTGELQFDGEKTSDKVVGYFCYFELLNGFNKTLYMTVNQMANHAKRYAPSIPKETTVAQLEALAFKNEVSKTVGWIGNFNGQGLKTVVRNLLSHYGYLSTEMITAFNDEGEPESRREEQLNAHNSTKHLNAEEVKFEEVNTPTSLAEGEKPANEPANVATIENAPY